VRVGLRANVSGVVATVFGSTGHLGYLTCDRLGSMGSQLVVPYRDDGLSVRINKVSGDPGQVVPMPYDFKDETSVLRTMEKSNLVVNLIGASKSTMHYSLHDANVKTAYRIAKFAKQAGVERFIHVSAFGADPNAQSEFLRTKYESEEAVKYFFPKATIVRPTIMYGQNDPYLNRFAMTVRNKLLPIIWSSDAKVQLVAARDVAVALQQLVAHPELDGKIWELLGPEVTTRGELAEKCMRIIGLQRHLIHVSSEESMFFAKTAKALCLPNKLLPYDLEQAELDQANMVLQQASQTNGLEALGIKPANFEMGLVLTMKTWMTKDAPARQGWFQKPTEWRPY